MEERTAPPECKEVQRFSHVALQGPEAPMAGPWHQMSGIKADQTRGRIRTGYVRAGRLIAHG